MSAPLKTSSSPSEQALPGLAEIEAAAVRLAGQVRRTPLLESILLNEKLGCRLLIKPEMLQVGGSFKFRGAYNRISQLNPAERKRGVVAFSSGNHAQGTALAAKLCGAPAWIIMPGDAPAIKIENTRAYGAEVILYDRHTENREAIGKKIASERGATLVPPFDDPHIIAGQGTVGLEIVAQCRELNLDPDIVMAPASGGGLIAGISTAIKAHFKSTQVIVAEPEEFADHGLSLAAGRRVSNPTPGHSFCDALLSPMPGELTFAINQKTLSGAVAVSDHEVENAIRTAFNYYKVVAEPGGAVPLAAVLANKLDVKGKVAVLVLSGGNIDPMLFSKIISRVEG